MFPHYFSYNLKSDTLEPVIDFNFNHRILILILMGHVIKANYLKHVFNCLKTGMNLNSNSYSKVVLNKLTI